MSRTRISGELRRPHHLDHQTGMYKGRQVLKPQEGSLIAVGKRFMRLPKIWPTRDQRLSGHEADELPDSLGESANSSRKAKAAPMVGFPLLSDSARDLQHRRLADAGRAADLSLVR